MEPKERCMTLMDELYETDVGKELIIGPEKYNPSLHAVNKRKRFKGRLYKIRKVVEINSYKVTRIR